MNEPDRPPAEPSLAAPPPASPTGAGARPAPDDARLAEDLRLLTSILGETIRLREGDDALARLEEVRQAAIALREGRLDGGRDAFARLIEALDLRQLELCARAFTQLFHLMNVAEEQHRIRVLRHRDRAAGPKPGDRPEGSIAAAVESLAAAGASADEARALLGRLFVMPVLTAHPTEARRRTLLDHLGVCGAALDRLDDPRPGAHEREEIREGLLEASVALYATDQARAARPSPIDEIRAGVHVFERTLLDVTPRLYRALDEALARSWPGEPFDVPPFLRFGTWMGGDRDGNPNVTAEVTRVAFERQRQAALSAYLADVDRLGRELSISRRRAPFSGLLELEESLEADRAALPATAARARRYAPVEPFREKLWFMRARLEGARGRVDWGYDGPGAYLADLALLDRALVACGLSVLARGPLLDARRRARVFGFHLASLDLRQHSKVHEAAVAELLARGGVAGYAALDEDARQTLLASLLERADIGAPRDRSGLSPRTLDLLATLDAIGRARRDLGPEACERWVVSFTSAPSDLLEVLFLARSAHLLPDELRPVPLLEQLEDLSHARALTERMLALGPLKASIRGELEVMIGYSDSGKQAGYVPSQVALYRAQEELSRVADAHGVMLTVFHGRGGAIGRGGGPSNRAIRAQPPSALRGRLRVTEQGETIAARYGRPEIARRDLEQMISAVISSAVDERLGRTGPPSAHAGGAAADAAGSDGLRATLDRAALAARRAYDELLSDRDRLARYAVAATPIQEVAELPLASRPAARRAGVGQGVGPQLSFEELRAIPWVFSWNQSRHGLPGWFGLGTALSVLARAEGPERARDLYETWPFFRALLDNAQLALVRADIDVAREYARLADDDARSLFALIEAEHARTVAEVQAVAGGGGGASGAGPDRTALLQTARRRNPYIDVLSHAQIELLRRYRAAEGSERERLREVLFVTINGIAAGLQTVG